MAFNTDRRLTTAMCCLSLLYIVYKPVVKMRTNTDGMPPEQCSISSASFQIDSRQDLAEIVQRLHFETGAEIGVASGQFSRFMLQHWPSNKMYIMVDPAHKRAHDFIEAYNNTLEWHHKTVFLRMFSRVAMEHIPAGTLDFAYVDAAHDYCAVRDDLDYIWSKIRPGGLLAGHDFLYPTEALSKSEKLSYYYFCADGTVHPGCYCRKYFSGVKKAVEEFAAKKGLQVHSSKSDIGAGITSEWVKSWLIRRPC